jgi:hypothetical protein
MRTSALAAILLLAVTACSGEQGHPGANGRSNLLRTTAEAPGSHCASGGTRLETGADDNGNQALDAAEVDSTVYVCNGVDGLPAATAPEAPGANCPQGGVKVTIAGGAPTYVCDGSAGQDGASVTMTPEPTGASCPLGGTRLQIGTGTPTYVCHGVAGQDGVSVVVTPEPPGTSCGYGGVKLQVGTSAPSFVCNGAPGAAGQDGASVTMTPEPPGIHCGLGGVRLQVGAGAPTYLCDGATGSTGQDGTSVTMTPEPPGASCGLGGVRLQVGAGPVSYLCSGAPAGTSLPTVATVGVSDVRYTAATVDADVTDDGSELIFARGVVLATHPAPTLHDTVYYASPGSGPFATLCGLLAPDTAYSVRPFATNALGTAYGEERSFTTRTLGIPALSTQVVSNITDTTATSGGNITDDGGTPILARGVCWSLASDPTIAGSCVSEGVGAGSYLALLTGLASNTAHHVRAFASNAQGTSYGEDRSFTTTLLPLATVTTSAPSAISYTTASGGGTVVSDHGAPVTSRGICWATTPAPTRVGTCSTEAGGMGTFTASMTGLAAGTTYYLRAYAVNGGGTSYGNEMTFTTLAASAPLLTTRSVIGISSDVAGSGGVISTDGGSPITAKGICWSINPSPTVANTRTTDGAGSAAFSSTMTGLTPLTTYYVRAWATNALGTAYGGQLAFATTDLVAPGPTVPVVGTSTSTITGSSTATSGGYVSNDGGSAISARGVCWGTSPIPTLADSCSADGGGIGYFSSTVTGLSGCGVIHYVRAYATNATGTGYGNQVTVSTGLLPTVTTDAVSAIGFYGATSGGAVADSGGCAITQKGVVWSWNPGPALGSPGTSHGAGSAPFVSSLTPLYANRTYYVRAYATNSVGTSYGPQVVFTTAEPSTPYLGQSYAGGIVFYVDGTGLHGLVVTPTDLGYLPWGCQGTNVSTSTAFGTGATNTAAIVASCGEASFAAKAADSLSLGGYTDWFLPSLGELDLVRTNLFAQGLGSLAAGVYLSSSQNGPDYYSILYFPNGNGWNEQKSRGNAVRAVRAF